MNLRSIVPACFAVLMTFVPQAFADNRNEVTIVYGQYLPQNVSAYCAPGNGCANLQDHITYKVAQSSSWRKITATYQASGSSLTNGDWGFCILGVQCSDGQYLTDSHRATTTCSVTCAAGQHAQSIDIEVGVNP